MSILEQKPSKLASFIKYLEEHDLVEFDVQGSGEQKSQNRLYIQKYVFLANRHGLDLPVDYNMYMYGPFSESLNEEYYSLSEHRKELYEPINSELPDSFRSDDFLSLIIGKDLDWLEVAATAIERNSKHTRKDSLLDTLHYMEYGISHDIIFQVVEELENKGLVKFY